MNKERTTDNNSQPERLIMQEGEDPRSIRGLLAEAELVMDKPEMADQISSLTTAALNEGEIIIIPQEDKPNPS